MDSGTECVCDARQPNRCNVETVDRATFNVSGIFSSRFSIRTIFRTNETGCSFFPAAPTRRASTRRCRWTLIQPITTTTTTRKTNKTLKNHLVDRMSFGCRFILRNTIFHSSPVFPTSTVFSLLPRSRLWHPSFLAFVLLSVLPSAGNSVRGQRCFQSFRNRR